MLKKGTSTLQYDLFPADDQIMKLITSNGIEFFTYQANSQAIWEDCGLLKKSYDFKIKPKDIVVDIGAHQGVIAINFAALGATVIAYEPHPVNFEILKRSVEINPHLDIHVEDKAVFSKSGTLLFNFGKTLTTGALSKVGRDWKRTEKSIEVESISYCDLLNRHKLKNIKLMKIDCEGSEYEFLMKAPKKFLRQVEYYFIESHPTKFYDPPVLEKFMRNLGYDVISAPAEHGCFLLICRRKSKQ